MQLLALEKEGIFTAAAPGKWEGKAGTHVPSAAKDGDAVTVAIKHVMVPKGEVCHPLRVCRSHLQSGVAFDEKLFVKSASTEHPPISGSLIPRPRFDLI